MKSGVGVQCLCRLRPQRGAEGEISDLAISLTFRVTLYQATVSTDNTERVERSLRSGDKRITSYSR